MREGERLYCGSSKCSNKTHRFHARLLKVLGTMELLHCAVLLAVLVNAHAEVNVAVGRARVEVKEGEAAELSCTTPLDIAFCTFFDPSGESLNMQPGIRYEDGRITYLGNDQKKDCGVKINNVQEKDNGEWKCRITAITDGNAKKGEQTATVIVVKPPTSVRIEGEESSMVLTYPTDSTKMVKCIAEGGRPAPSFSWMLDNDLYHGAVVDQEGAQVLTYKTEPEHNGKTLSCVVNHKGYSEDDMTADLNKASVALDIRFKPVASTKDSAFYGMKLGQKFDVLLNFKSHPEPTEMHWEMHDGITVAQASSNDRYVSALMTPGPHPGHFTAKLTINEVKLEDQESENKLVVTNELGMTEYRFSLGLGEKPPVEASSGPVIAIVIVALIIVVVIVVAVVARSHGMLCFADKNVGDDVEKSAAQFEALEKGEPSPEKEMIKEPIIDVKKEPEPMVAIPESIPAPAKVEEAEKEEKKSNGAHTPV